MSTEERRWDGDDHGTRIALLEQGMAMLTKELQGINTNISRLVWIVIVAVVGAGLKLVLIG